MNQDYALDVPKTAKDLIKQPKMAEDGVLPKLHYSMIVVGSSGSGKSVLVFNMISKWYKNSFDMVVLISPTGKTDDIQKALNLPDSSVIDDMEVAEKAVAKIEEVQEEKIQTDGYESAKKVLLYFDDVIGDPLFMKSNAMIKAFIKNRHYGFSDILCSQYFKAIPRRMRVQATCSIFFDCSETEMDTIAEDFLPPGVPKKIFLKKLQEILSERYAFVTYMKTSPWKERWRRGLAHVIDFGAVDIMEETRPAKRMKVIEK